jgi:regulator of sirC expression with transglutaminase-like and TPR domain
MTYSTAPFDVLTYFSNLVASDESFPLLEAAASLAHDEYPDLDIGNVLADVDRMAAKVRQRLPSDAGALQRLRVLNQYFYGEMGFAANLNHYYDPENSFVSSVIRQRRGIPITLAVIWLEVAQAVGLKASGVSFPGHFLVKIKLPNGHAMMDPVTGLSLSREDLLERLAPFIQQKGANQEADVILALYLQSAAPRDIVARMLRNLKEIYLNEEDWPRVLQVLDRLTVLLPEGWDYFRERGMIHADRGQLKQAEDDLSVFLKNSPDHGEFQTVQAKLQSLRTQRN